MELSCNLNCTANACEINYKHRWNNLTEKDNQKYFHSHDECELYFILSGDVEFFVETNIYPLKQYDMLIIKPHEVHTVNIKSYAFFDRIMINIPMMFAKTYKTAHMNILRCFCEKKFGVNNIITFTENQLDDVVCLFRKIDNQICYPSDLSEILMFSWFNELLVIVNHAFTQNKSLSGKSYVPDSLRPVLNYINNNIEGDLSVDKLSSEFHISKHYLPYLFKKSIGTSMHDYILSKRIAKAKILLTDSFSVTEACFLSGFNDYTHFITTFKRKVGITPLKYKKNVAV